MLFILQYIFQFPVVFPVIGIQNYDHLPKQMEPLCATGRTCITTAVGSNNGKIVETHDDLRGRHTLMS